MPNGNPMLHSLQVSAGQETLFFYHEAHEVHATAWMQEVEQRREQLPKGNL